MLKAWILRGLHAREWRSVRLCSETGIWWQVSHIDCKRSLPAPLKSAIRLAVLPWGTLAEAMETMDEEFPKG
jgi:hypothetical protein